MVDENKKTNLMQQQSQLLKIVRPPPILVTTKKFFSSRGWGELLGNRPYLLTLLHLLELISDFVDRSNWFDFGWIIFRGRAKNTLLACKIKKLKEQFQIFKTILQRV